MDNNSIVEQKHWNIGYENQILEVVSENDPIRELIIHHIPHGEGGNCIEIGAYPCRYLSIFGELGYELYGIDTTEKIESNELKMLMKLNNWNYKVLQKKNFLELNNEDTYNIVCSFGFIEHFENWPEIILRHTSLLKDDGYLIITTPNFAGFFQRIFHFLVDNENYKRHIIESMNPKKWATVLGKKYKIIYAGYFGKFTFWYENHYRNIFQKMLTKCFSIMGRLLRRLPCCRLYSPFCGLIVRKLS